MKISVFYEIFVLPAVSGTEKEKALNERQKIMDLILKGDTAECEKIINERKKITINLTAKEIKTLMTAYLSVNTNMINLKDLYMFFNLISLADNLEKSFAEYIDALDGTILASASLGSGRLTIK
jgi:predicted aldo/keto reductase-like oxidoreductase